MLKIREEIAQYKKNQYSLMMNTWSICIFQIGLKNIWNVKMTRFFIREDLLMMREFIYKNTLLRKLWTEVKLRTSVLLKIKICK